jgi:hypothetical protein
MFSEGNSEQMMLQQSFAEKLQQIHFVEEFF